MVPGSYEEGMVLWQHKNKVSLFACNAGEIFSNESVELAPGLKTSKINSDLKCEYGGDSGTALNAWIFIEFWRKVLENKVYSEHDWTVKVDVDAVFFPDRLLTVLKDNSGAAWISNCKYGLHGPIEVVSSGALDKLAEDYEASFDGKAPKNCVEKQDFGLWGEDMFLGQCLDKVLEVGDSPVDPRVLCEDHCDCPAWYWCQNGTDRVSFHPFKTVGAYKNCMANAMGGEPLPEGASALDDDDEEFAAHSPSTQAEAPESEDDGEPADADAGEEAEAPASGGGGESLGADAGEESTAHTAPHPTESQADFYADEDGGGAGGGGRAGGGAGSCADYGCTEAFNSDFNCQCNKGCKAHNSCCPDFEDECGGSAASGAAGGKSASGDSCQSDCDVKFDPRRTCQCNALCESHGNCCDDYLESCAGGRA
ncbi:unnamed protein product [Prorocentrum cordatum]|uniref:SMB domain-containing protein n=1 Tax=Prorocentrum cordatum TaxID=2364126 RepID=A0ABN9R4S1_9DINO|nr:unnamed protein product [Polarella glacialis]